MLGLDTNIVLRWLLDDTILVDDAPHQTALVSSLILESEEPFFVSQVVIAEAIWVLRNRVRLTKEIVDEVISRLLSSNIEIQDKHAIENALASFKEGHGDFADHLIGAVNLAAGCRSTVTLDRKAGRSAGFTKLRK